MAKQPPSVYIVYSMSDVDSGEGADYNGFCRIINSSIYPYGVPILPCLLMNCTRELISYLPVGRR